MSHPFNPEMLTLARMSRGITQTELATKVETNQGRISKIEHGFLVPDDALVNRLAETLNYPCEFFFQPGYIHTLPSWFHRKRKQVSQTTLGRIHAEIAIRIRHIVQLLMSAEIRVLRPLPQYDIDQFDGDVENIARVVREVWGIARGPIADLALVLEEAGIVLVPCEFGTTDVDAIGMWLQGMPPMVFFNTSAPTDRVRFSIAHEVGHLIMHATPTEDIEAQANRFAAEFLMPEYDIRPQLSNVSLSVLAILKKIWLVSMQALLKRARDLRTISEKKATALWKQMSALGFRKREPAELDLPPERPQLLRELIHYHTKELGISEPQLRSMFRLLEADYQRLYAWAVTPKRNRLQLVG